MNIEKIIRLAREGALLIILIIIGYRLVNTEFSINLGTLSATDVVAIILAFFAIALSAAFYFKSSEASNNFYDNMHKFTQDTSVILGKIESKFGEQLKNIEERSADLKASVEKYYSNSDKNPSSDLDSAKETTENQVKETKKQYSIILEDVFSKVQLDTDEKTALKESLISKEQEIERLQLQLAETTTATEEELRSRVRRYLVKQIIKRLEAGDTGSLTAMEFFLKILDSSMTVFRRDAEKLGFITDIKPTSEDEVTEKGFGFFMSALDKALTEFDA